MDVVRLSSRPRVVARMLPAAVLALVLAGAAAWSLPGLLARRIGDGPSLARDAIVTDTVVRGTLERSVTAAGILVPDRVHVVATVADGIVAALPVRAGSHVGAGSVIARLDNPELAVNVADASAQLDAARADVRSAREEAAAARLDEDAALRSARAESARASAEARADTDLRANGLIADLQYRSAIIKSEEDRDLLTIARSKIAVGGADADAKVAAAQARVDQLAAALAARRAELATLTIVAGTAGVVQSVAIDPGQRVTSGTELVRIADERDLKAVLQVAESDVRGIVPGMRARITAGDAGTSDGRVGRIAPAAQNGTVAVDIALARLPPGARADQNVDGTIVMDRTPNALSLARPAGLADAGRIALYRLDRDGSHAVRTEVVLRPGSEDRVRVESGLAAGDRIIVSDTTALDAPSLRIRP
jgi:multidrug efflux pump subunit AcrA (membrane-fusion protein)